MSLSREIFKDHPILMQFIFWIGLPLIVVFVTIYGVVRTTLPDSNLTLQIPGMKSSVRVVRDDIGIPDIQASSDMDAFTALGYVHAQDRMWQMEYGRRLAQGRLSEIFGKATLSTDKFMRTLGIYDAAANAFGHLPKESQLVLDAYVKGINHWIEQTPWWQRPLEYLFFNLKPEAWTRADTLVQIKLLALNLSANYKNELVNQNLVAQLGVDKFNQLFIGEHDFPFIDESNNIASCGSACLKIQSGIQNLHDELGFVQVGVGSNAWVVSGKYTKSGAPHLASDPHLALSLPTTFYLANISGDKLDVTGATIPGLPMVVFGKNSHIAWGATNASADVQDLYIEKTNKLDNGAYFHDGEWKKYNIEYETIKVASDFPAFLRPEYRPLEWPIRSSVHGPIISDIASQNGSSMSLRWTALDADDSSFSAFLAINYASNWGEFNEALNMHVAPVLSFVFADKENNIGVKIAGRIPKRHGSSGVIPTAGWDTESEWRGFIGVPDLPEIYNPNNGFIVTANNRFYSEQYPHLISNNWRPGYRAQIISESLQQGMIDNHKFSIKDSVGIQFNVVDLQARELLTFLQQLPGKTEKQLAMLKLFQKWPATMDKKSGAAIVYQSWLRHFSNGILIDDLTHNVVRPSEYAQLAGQANILHPLFIRAVVNGEFSQWCDKVNTEEKESCELIALEALNIAYEELRLEIGANPESWELGEILTSRYQHRPFTASKALSLFFDKDLEAQGSLFTVDVAGSRYNKGEGYTKVLGAVYRQVIDLGDENCSYMALDLGQSGNLLSPHYDDMMNKEMQLLNKQLVRCTNAKNP